MGQIDPKHTFPVGQERVVRNAAHAPGAGVRRARFQARLFRISGGLACEQSQKVGVGLRPAGADGRGQISLRATRLES